MTTFNELFGVGVFRRASLREAKSGSLAGNAQTNFADPGIPCQFAPRDLTGSAVCCRKSARSKRYRPERASCSASFSAWTNDPGADAPDPRAGHGTPMSRYGTAASPAGMRQVVSGSTRPQEPDPARQRIRRAAWGARGAEPPAMPAAGAAPSGAPPPAAGAAPSGAPPPAAGAHSPGTGPRYRPQGRASDTGPRYRPQIQASNSARVLASVISTGFPPALGSSSAIATKVSIRSVPTPILLRRAGTCISALSAVT